MKILIAAVLLVQVLLLFGLQVLYQEIQEIKGSTNAVHEYQYKEISKPSRDI